MQFSDPCVVHDCKNKVMGFTFGSGNDLVIPYFFRVSGFGLGSSHVSGFVWDCLVVDGGIGGIG